MLDIYLEVKDYTDVTTGLGLITLTLIKLNIVQLWQHFFFPQLAPRPLSALRHRQHYSLQKAWAALIAAIIMLIPANMLLISIIYLNGSCN